MTGHRPYGVFFLVQHRSTDFNSCACAVDRTSSIELKNSILLCFYPLSLHSLPQWRFFKSEPNPNKLLAKSTHDLGEIDTGSRLSTPGEIDTWSQWNRHTISTWQNGPTSSKWITITLTIDFKWSHRIQIEFVVPSGNSLQTPISIVKIFKFQLSHSNGMHHTI